MSQSTITTTSSSRSSSSNPPTIPIRLLTWNLRYDSLPNSIPVNTSISNLPLHLPADQSLRPYSSAQEQPWSTRRIFITREILFHQPGIICFQEALSRQISDLGELLPGYEYIGVGRDDGKLSGEYEAIFWRRDMVQLINGDWDTFWLSETPEVPSRFPGAGSVRSATRGRFRVYGGREITVVCTHWDEQSDAQRKLAASLVRMRGAHELSTTGNPVFILGDFNSPRQGVDSGGYQIMTGKADPVKVNKTFEYNFGGVKKGWGFLDLAEETNPLKRSGHAFTFTGFKRHGSMDVSRIDFILGSRSLEAYSEGNDLELKIGGNGWKVERFRIGENWYDQEGISSDHRPVYADVLLG
ncbi:plasminogen-binding protein pgbB [Pyronema omphalodes]|nr:plasminogen-binding protein pgbB [Pyronema omphalodes]